MPFKAKEASWKKLLEVADVAALSKEERVLYNEALKHYRDYHNTIDFAFDRGKKDGKEIGEKIGERTSQIRIDKRLKDKEIGVSLIMDATGLSEEEIRKL